MELRNYLYLTEDVLPQLGFRGTFDAALKTKMESGMADTTDGHSDGLD